MHKLTLACMTALILAACGTNPYQAPTNQTKEKVATNNKQTVGIFLGAVLQQDQAKMRELANENYIQHNPFIPTGLEAFIQLLPVLKQNGTTAENVRMFEDGNYVIMHNVWHNAKPFGAYEMVSFDIIRLDENGKVAEHWDVLMPQTPPNPSGRTLTDGETVITDLDKTEANKQQISKWIDVRSYGTPEQVVKFREAFFAHDYKQHNPVAADGLKGFLLARKSEQWEFTKLHKVLGEGNFVLSISEGMVKGKHSAFYDLFRIENGKVVEHWDVIQPIPKTGLANNNGMFGFM